ncbi:dynein heavy chain 2, axonemal-like, partial [Stegodyphus dumicola]|uniref:dynein heavy chain 2, axonemal-like n=1 Tax=Stegodyphus dumicola TaxID=202533 RepID=UPI0015ADCE2B
LPDETDQKEKISRIFWMSIIYSLGITVDEKDEQYFIAYIKQLDVSLPNFGSVFDYGLDNNMEWFKWSNLLPDVWEPHLGVYSENWLIPTEKTLQYEYILSLFMKEMKPVLIVGKTGAGKTIIIENLLKRLNSDSYMHHVINISSQTTSARLQRMLESKLEKKAGGVLFPPLGRRLIVFLDNFNMAKQDQYGSQSALELLHMEIDNKIWYNRDKWKINSIQNITFIAAMSPPRRSESKISQPLLNRFNVINIIPPQDQELKRIFITLLRKKFVEPSLDIRRLINAITLGSIKVYKSVMEIFLPTPAKLHYLFSLRDIKK